MLLKAKALKGYALHCLDGEIGKVREFYFDDQHWAVRYLVVDTGNWLADRQVLVSPHALRAVKKVDQTIAVSLTKKQIMDSPSLDSDKPVSRQFEEAYYSHFQWPAYWSGPHMWGNYPNIVRDLENWKVPTQAEKSWNPHLRSSHAVSGYHIQATDGEIGHVDDFIIDDETWAIRYLVIDTQNWLPGKKVLLSPRWIERVDWGDSKVFINLSREVIKQSPEYTEKTLLTREYENQLHQHYSREGYWVV
jgi:hypothetical protein